jgi:hypothetical protein
METLQLQKRLNRLSVSKRVEVSDFIDFLLSKQDKELSIKKPIFGCAKGHFQLTNDFNAPLDDFKEYM